MNMDRNVGGSSPRRRGRPRLPVDRVKQASLSIRTPRPLHDKISHEAALADRSLAEEAQRRIEEAYAGEERYGGARLAAVLRRLAAAAKTIEARYQVSPLVDALAFKALRRSWLMVIDDEAPWKEPVLLGAAVPVVWQEPGRTPRRCQVQVVLWPGDMPAEQAEAVYGSLIKVSANSAAQQIELTIKEPAVAGVEEQP
jgi:hypothetical protein